MNEVLLPWVCMVTKLAEQASVQYTQGMLDFPLLPIAKSSFKSQIIHKQLLEEHGHYHIQHKAQLRLRAY